MKPVYTEPTFPKPSLPDREARVQYYREIAPLMLPWIERRPLNLLRCLYGDCFFQRNRMHPATDADFGPPIRSVPIEQKNGRTEDYLYVDDVGGILACVAQSTIEFHAWGTSAEDVEHPDRIAIDLDPGEGTGFEEVKDAALQVRRSLEAIGLESWALLSGGKGIHVVVPIEPDQDWAGVRGFAHQFCTVLAEAAPERFTVSLPKAQRRGRIFLDYLRNQRTATAIMPYSMRARHGAPVAAPISWDELNGIASADIFTVADADLLRRRARSLKGWGKSRQSLPRL